MLQSSSKYSNNVNDRLTEFTVTSIQSSGGWRLIKSASKLGYATEKLQVDCHKNQSVNWLQASPIGNE